MHKIKNVKTEDSFVIRVVFQNGVEKAYDMKKLFEIFPQFRAFETIDGLFDQIKTDVGGYGVFWNDELDLAAEEIWENGIETGIFHEMSVYETLAGNLVKAREQRGMTQKELSEATKIYQADISKIERSLSNPSVSTLQRIAEGLGMKLIIKFEEKESDNHGTK